jgi:hypothetical protein
VDRADQNKNVIVFDVCIRRLVRNAIPNRLKQTARHQPSIRQFELLPALQNDGVVGVAQDVGGEGLFFQGGKHMAQK